MSKKYKHIEKQAQQIHKKLKLRFPVNLHLVCKEHGLDINYAPMENIVSGMLVVGKDKGAMVINKHHSTTRQRFSIAHEIGHALLHQDLRDEFVDKIHYRKTLEEPIIQQEETEANVFAASLLMPKEEIGRIVEEAELIIFDDETIQNLADYFGVSIQAMTIRLNILGYIPDWTML